MVRVWIYNSLNPFPSASSTPAISYPPAGRDDSHAPHVGHNHGMVASKLRREGNPHVAGLAVTDRAWPLTADPHMPVRPIGRNILGSETGWKGLHVCIRGHEHFSIRPGAATLGLFLKGLLSADASALCDNASDERNPGVGAGSVHDSAARKAATARPPNAVRTA